MWPIPGPVIVNSCLFSRLDGGPDILHEAGEDAVNWLEWTTVQPQIIQKLYTSVDGGVRTLVLLL